MRLDDPELVTREYADESRFAVRASVWRSSTGPDPLDVVLEALAEVAPARVLEVGAGRGELAERIGREMAVEIVALDQSARMVELARSRGIQAIGGDVRALPFADGSFDAAVAAWMLYHVPDRQLALRELARVLRPNGRLVVVTNSERNLLELWTLFGERARCEHPFSCENGEPQVRKVFPHVGRRSVQGTVTFDRETARNYVAASPIRAHLANDLPEFEEPLVAGRRVCVLAADK